MKLITKAIEATLPPLYSTEKQPAAEKVARVKFFAGGRGTWYAVEGERQELDDGRMDLTMFGFCVSPLGPDCDEWGYFSLVEFEDSRLVERDLYFTPAPIGEVIAKRHPEIAL